MDGIAGPLNGAFQVGPLTISVAVMTTWGIMFLLGLFSVFATRRLTLEPGTVQVVCEGFVLAIDDAIRNVLPEHSKPVLPFVATLWVFILVANLVGIIPGIDSPTADLSVTGALALLVFFSVHWFGIRADGLQGYLRHYIRPNPILLPFHIISEITRTIALAVRLFGNMMSLELTALLVLLVAGFLVPIPLLMLHIVEALIQAYIFGMLALVYIASAIQTQQLQREQRKG